METATPLEEPADPVTRSVEREGVVVSLTLDRTRALGESLGFSCNGSDAGPAELAPGASWSFDMVWLGLLSHRLPAPAGQYRADFVFPFIARGRLDAYEGNSEDADPITVGVAFQVVGEPFAGVSPTTALDRALADPRVATWLAGLEFREIEIAGIVLVGDQWLFRVDSRG